MWLFLQLDTGCQLKKEEFRKKMRRIWGKRDAFGHDKRCIQGKQEKILEKTRDAFGEIREESE